MPGALLVDLRAGDQRVLLGALSLEALVLGLCGGLIGACLGVREARDTAVRLLPQLVGTGPVVREALLAHHGDNEADQHQRHQGDDDGPDDLLGGHH